MRLYLVLAALCLSGPMLAYVDDTVLVLDTGVKTDAFPERLLECHSHSV
jgi:hypothetical protein